jgi:hypothetical protein
MRSVTERLGRAWRLSIEIRRVPRVVLRAMGLFVPIAREVAEMAYQWDAPYLLDDSRFRAAFGGVATPFDKVVAGTAAWATATYGGPQGATGRAILSRSEPSSGVR